MRVEPEYVESPGAIWIVTVPPVDAKIIPLCTAAVQIEESSVYVSVPQIEPPTLFAGHA